MWSLALLLFGASCLLYISSFPNNQKGNNRAPNLLAFFPQEARISVRDVPGVMSHDGLGPAPPHAALCFAIFLSTPPPRSFTSTPTPTSPPIDIPRSRPQITSNTPPNPRVFFLENQQIQHRQYVDHRCAPLHPPTRNRTSNSPRQWTRSRRLKMKWVGYPPPPLLARRR